MIHPGKCDYRMGHLNPGVLSLQRPFHGQETPATRSLGMPASISGSFHQCGTNGGQLQNSVNKAVLALSGPLTSTGKSLCPSVSQERKILETEGLLNNNHHAETAESAISQLWQVRDQCELPPGGLRAPLVQQAVSRWGGPSHRPGSAPLSSQPIGTSPGIGPRSPQPPVRTARAHFVSHGFM